MNLLKKFLSNSIFTKTINKHSESCSDGVLRCLLYLPVWAVI